MRFSDIKQNPWDYDKKTVLNALKRYFTVDMPTDSPYPITKDSYTIYLTDETTETIPVTLETHLNTSDAFEQLTGHIDTTSTQKPSKPFTTITLKTSQALQTTLSNKSFAKQLTNPHFLQPLTKL